MKRLVIAIDCDDVLVESTRLIVDTYNKLYGTSVLLESAHVSGNPDWQAEREEVHRRIKAIQLTKEYGKLTPSAQVLGAVGRLAQHHELHLVTARSIEIAAVTRHMIDTYFPGCFTSIEHVGFNTSKNQVCLAIDAEVLIDDSLKQLMAAQSSGVDALLWYGDYPWQDRSDVPEGIIVAKSWPEILQKIEALSNG